MVDTNELLRQRVLRLVKKHGVSQKVLAGKMGMSPPTFSRWLNQKKGTGPASVAALDGFNAFAEELTAGLDPLITTQGKRRPDHESQDTARARGEETALRKRGRST